MTIDKRLEALLSPPSIPCALGGTVYTAPPAPTRCDQCGKTGDRLRAITSGHWECSNLVCPMRRRITAGPSDRPQEPKE